MAVLPPATGTTLTNSASDGQSGNSLKGTIYYDKVTGVGCMGGLPEYKMLKATYRFQRADSQFTGRWVSGHIYVSAHTCNGRSIYSKKVTISPGVSNLTSGTTYTKSFGTSSYVIIPYAADQFFAVQKVDLYRGSSKQGRLCAVPKVNTYGNPCT